MPVLVQARPDDEIADVIEKVRAAGESEVGLVLPRGSRALQTPLSARLLSQFSKQRGQRTAIVSDEPRVQELARANGFPVYASVPAFERGIQLGTSVVAPGTYRTGTATAAATALQEAPPRAFTPRPTLDAVPPSTQVRRGGPPSLPPKTPKASVWATQRRPLYFAGAAAALIGLLLFFAFAPSAKVTITVAGTPVSVNPTIQGSTDPAAAKQGDHLLTSVITASGSGKFAASPTGSQTLPATPAGGKIVFTTNVPEGAQFSLNQGAGFQTSDGSVNYLVTQGTYICISATGSPPPTTADCGGQQPNDTTSIQAESSGRAGNVPAGTVTKWNPPSEDPCTGNPFCNPSPGTTYDVFVTNPAATSGGADQKQVTVASPSDVNSWTTQVTQIENTLTNQVNSQMQGRAGGKTFAVDPNGGGKSIAFTVTPHLPSAGSQFSATQITVSAQASAAVYDPADVRNDIVADLNAKVTQGDQLAPGKLSVQPCQVTQAATDGTVILACAASDFVQPVVDLQGLKTKLAGKNPGDAEKIIEGAVDKVQNVDVSEFPFKLFYLPFFSSRIEIDENFVSQTSSGT